MKYRQLSKIFHADPSPSRESNILAEAKSRLEQESTFRLGYESREGELFIATPRELSVLSEKILRTERRVSRQLRSLPSIAEHAVLRGLVLDEVVSSAEIEGIRSTRREIKNALNSAKTENPSGKRFKELATLYLDIIDGVSDVPSSLQDIRRIYDRVMYGELEDADKPDGNLFRAQGVDVSTGMKVVHRGLEPEHNIEEALEAMLRIAGSDELPALYSAAAAHYLFEYAHPFYDGNGRTGRYLLALHMSVPLSMATSLSLSRAIARNKSSYYKAFSSAQNPLNHGELTHFVFHLLKLVSEAQTEIVDRLGMVDVAYSEINAAAQDIGAEYNLKQREVALVFMLMQYEAFGFFGDAPLPDIARGLQVGEQMARKHVKVLEEKGVVSKVRGRNPVAFALTENFKQQASIRPLEWDRK